MKLNQFFMFGVALAIPQFPFAFDASWEPPSAQEGAAVARTLVQRESLVNINTVDSDGIPVSSMEYYADCNGTGNPYWLVVDIGSTFQNIKRGLALLWTIRVGDHPVGDSKVDLRYPGGIVSSPAGSPRVTLYGELQKVDESNTDIAALEKCFLTRHPDAKWWLPSRKNAPHKAHWVKLNVDKVCMIGGFGDRAFIGTIDGDLYQQTNPLV